MKKRIDFEIWLDERIPEIYWFSLQNVIKEKDGYSSRIGGGRGEYECKTLKDAVKGIKKKCDKHNLKIGKIYYCEKGFAAILDIQ